MLRLSLTLDDIEYEKAIDIIFPIIFKGKLAAIAPKGIAKAALKNKSREEKDIYVAAFINQHSDKIKKHLQNELSEYEILTKINGINAVFE